MIADVIDDRTRSRIDWERVITWSAVLLLCGGFWLGIARLAGL